MSLYERALEIAKRAHKSQKRKDGEDYINHPVRVAERVKQLFENSGAIEKTVDICMSIAVLHDVIEDSPMNFEDLNHELGVDTEFLYILALLTKVPDQDYLGYILKIKDNGIAQIIKICDLEDNLGPAAKGTLRDKYLLAKYILEN